ncbi:hypothetical protein [Asticcacaulis sp. EMRT-3]|uniref:ATP-grasp domain-containing protein n=1 Tax=Asticcacaulis sp. EMRT-3 TaxID=3040349 RepID=UPI0024AF26E7|nr:hypothetical protein [Asticcacaulis sp. EMRT-3]MDI7776665.1 hypothetical protein [Asticcacaulis sp. EMRT-3]
MKTHASLHDITGMSEIVRTCHHGKDITPLWDHLIKRATDNPDDASALMDISTILLSRGQAEDGLTWQGVAIGKQRDYCITHGDGSGLSILAFVTAGDMMANTPLDFLLHGSNCRLWLCFVDASTQSLPDLPPHDVAFLAVGESTANQPVLERLEVLLKDWPGPILNNDPAMIASLTRDGVSQRLKDAQALLSPATIRLGRAALAAVSQGAMSLTEAAQGMDFPVILRPIGTHAGKGMHRLSNPDELAGALRAETADAFYIIPFIDYRNADGLYAKQRIVQIKGRPFASHEAISSHWMVHYMNADMHENAGKRAAEAQWMKDFDQDFAVRHAAAFAELYALIGLDYFGMDCAELPDGRLLIFELDVAMVVHDMDDEALYAYKKPAMRRLFDAFIDMAAQEPQAMAMTSA